MARKMALVCGAALLLSACSSYPRLVAITPVSAAPNSETPDVDAALREAAILQAEYSTGYSESAQIRDFSQLPIIGAAAIAAWVLLDARPNAARRTGRIGILAGAYSEARGQLMAGDMPEAYIAGHAALTCVMAQGLFFSGTQAQQRHTDLKTAMTDLGEAIADMAEVVSWQPTIAAPPRGTRAAQDEWRAARAAEVAMLNTTKTAAEQAIAQAGTAMDAARTEDMAYQGAGSVFWLAVSSISARVASRGRQRPAVDYQTLARRFSPDGGTASAEGGVTRGAVDIMSEINLRMRTLVARTSDLRNATPDYSARLERAAGCPAQAG